VFYIQVFTEGTRQEKKKKDSEMDGSKHFQELNQLLSSP